MIYKKKFEDVEVGAERKDKLEKKLKVRPINGNE